jgi:hypothetical protein
MRYIIIIFILAFNLFHLKAQVEVSSDSLILPSCLDTNFYKEQLRGWYVHYVVILFESENPIDISTIKIKTDEVKPYDVVYYDPETLKVTYYCYLGLNMDDIDPFKFTESYAKYLFDLYQPDYPKIKIERVSEYRD